MNLSIYMHCYFTLFLYQTFQWTIALLVSKEIHLGSLRSQRIDIVMAILPSIFIYCSYCSYFQSRHYCCLQRLVLLPLLALPYNKNVTNANHLDITFQSNVKWFARMLNLLEILRSNLINPETLLVLHTPLLLLLPPLRILLLPSTLSL